MNVRKILWLVFSCFFWFSPKAMAGDLTCYGYTSTTSYFSCGTHGNCTWWAAYKRPDLAAKRIGSGWDAKNWYDKFQTLGFPVGSEPKVGAVAVFNATENNSAGHVAYVEKPYTDGSFDTSEMDWYGTLGSDGLQYGTYRPDGNGKYHRNGGPQSWTLKGFIYYKTPCDPSKEQCYLRKNGNIAWYPPVANCEQASQWFQLSDTDSQTSRVIPVTKAQCPLACYAN